MPTNNPPKLSKSELYEMLRQAVRNTGPQAKQRASDQKPAQSSSKLRKRSRKP